MSKIIMFDNQYNCKRLCKLLKLDLTSNIDYLQLYNYTYNLFIDKAYKFADDNRSLFITQDFTKEDLLYELIINSNTITLLFYLPAVSTIPNNAKSKILIRAEKRFCKSKIKVIYKKNVNNSDSNADILQSKSEEAVPKIFAEAETAVGQFVSSGAQLVSQNFVSTQENSVPEQITSTDSFLNYLEEVYSITDYIDRFIDASYNVYDFYTKDPSFYPDISDIYNDTEININDIGLVDEEESALTISYGKIFDLSNNGSNFKNINYLYIAHDFFYVDSDSIPNAITLKFNDRYFDFKFITTDSEAEIPVLIYQFFAEQKRNFNNLSKFFSDLPLPGSSPGSNNKYHSVSWVGQYACITGGC